MAGNIYALLVGIDNYPPGIAPLSGCINDIEAIEAYLRERVANCQIKILKNEQSTYQAIVDGFRTHLRQAGEADTALFYYAGHGSQEMAPPEFWAVEPDRMNETLVCYDARVEGGKALADKELAKLVAEVAENNPHIAVIMDCCHSGSGTRNPFQEVAERRLEPDLRVRPIESYLVSPAEVEAMAPTTRDPEARPSGWQLPRGRHVLLAACRNSQTAKEYNGGGQRRGAFSYYLGETLKTTNGNLSYRDVFERASALVQTKVADQHPQLEAIVPDDLDLSFLGGAVIQRVPYFTVRHDSQYGWIMDGGAVHGIPNPQTDQTTELALFSFETSAEQLERQEGAIATATVTKVLPQLSQIQINGLTNPDPNTVFKSVITRLPVPPMGVRLEGDADGVQLVRQALRDTRLDIPGEQSSLYVQEATEATAVEFRVLARNEEYIVARPTDDRPLIAQIPGYTPDNAALVVQRLEHIARWNAIAELSSPASGPIPANAVQLQLFQGNSGEAINATQIRLEYQQDSSGQWQEPSFRAKLVNTSDKRLYCALFDLTDLFAVDCLIEAGGIWLNPHEEVSVLGGEPLYVSVPDPLWRMGVTEYRDILKLIVSTDEFDALILQQDSLEAPRTITRDIRVRKAEAQSGWVTSQVTITTVRPQQATPLSPSNSTNLGAGVTLASHPGLQAQASLTTVNQATRDLGNLITPPVLRTDATLVQPFQFTTSRGTDPGLSALELKTTDAQSYQSVTSTQPLKLTVDTALSENETILPVAYDGEFYLPLGVGVGKGNQTEITIDRLPEPVSSGERSLGGSIRIFFQKVLTQKLSQVTNQILNIEFPYPLLSAVTVPSDRDIAPEDYDANPANVRVKVAGAQKIVVFIHGIIGDTYSMTPCVKHAKVKMDGQVKSIAEMYDLVLGFDYENLNTSIEDNARLLKQRLEAVGLATGHGKTLHIVAHSMGGLVSRWFIEREGGNQMVSHLIMLGTPNGGSPWPNVQEMVTPLLAIGLNSLAAIALPMPAIAALLKLAGTAAKKIEDIDISLDQMKADSEFQKALATSPDPGIPYTILAGNTSLRPEALPAPGQTTSPIQRLMGKVFDRVVELPFLPNQPNDIAVTVKSIENVSQARSPQPIKTPVACNHLVYFIHQDGLNALALAVTNALNTASSASTTSTTSTVSTISTASPASSLPIPSPAVSSTPVPTPALPTAAAGLPVATRIEPEVPPAPAVVTAASTPITTPSLETDGKPNFWLGFILGLLAGIILTSIFLFIQQQSNSPEPATPSSFSS